MKLIVQNSMDKLNRVVLIGGMIIIGLLAFIAFKPAVEQPMAGVSPMGEYHYTQFSGAIATTTLVCSDNCALGSVIITEDFAGTLVFKEATSTTAYAITNATQVVDMQSALTEGTYTFDVAIPGYLYMVSADGFSFAGDITVSWRDY